MAIGESGPWVEASETVKAQWLGRLEALVNEVKTWAEASGWRTRRIVNER